MNTMGDITTTFTSAIVPGILMGSARYGRREGEGEGEGESSGCECV